MDTFFWNFAIGPNPTHVCHLCVISYRTELYRIKYRFVLVHFLVIMQTYFIFFYFFLLICSRIKWLGFWTALTNMLEAFMPFVVYFNELHSSVLVVLVCSFPVVISRQAIDMLGRRTRRVAFQTNCIDSDADGNRNPTTNENRVTGGRWVLHHIPLGTDQRTDRPDLSLGGISYRRWLNRTVFVLAFTDSALCCVFVSRCADAVLAAE